MRSVSKAREVHALMQAGALDGLSIGFRTVKSRRDRATGVRRIQQVDLWEISIVTFPLLPAGAHRLGEGAAVRRPTADGTGD